MSSKLHQLVLQLFTQSWCPLANYAVKAGVVCLCDPHLSASEVRFSRRGAIQIYVYLYLVCLLLGKSTAMKPCVRGIAAWPRWRTGVSGIRTPLSQTTTHCSDHGDDDVQFTSGGVIGPAFATRQASLATPRHRSILFVYCGQ